jgi:Tfp pilus assembly protein PilX
MVTRLGILLLGQQAADPVLEQLDPPRRAAVVMALLALVLTGLLLVTIAMLGGHWVRRLARSKPGRWRAANEAEAARKNRELRESLRSVLPETPTDDTIHLHRGAQDTKAD